MRPRKTIDIETFKDEINSVLCSEVYTREQREAFQIITEKLLMAHGAYKGFSYLRRNEVPAGHLPGINANFNEDISNIPLEERFNNTDGTRVYFY
jgi:hypothetical protein